MYTVHCLCFRIECYVSLIRSDSKVPLIRSVTDGIPVSLNFLIKKIIFSVKKLRVTPTRLINIVAE
jgi:hypothetical protein